MLTINTQQGQSIYIGNVGENLLDLKVLKIDVKKSNVIINATDSEGHCSSFAMEPGKEVALRKDVKMVFKAIKHYKSDARSVDYVVLGFEAPREIRIKGSWKKFNK